MRGLHRHHLPELLTPVKRTLSLKREHLADLTPRELTAVAGAAVPSSPVQECLEESHLVCTWTCPSYCTSCPC